MATRSSDIARRYDVGVEPMFNDIPMTVDIVYEGSAVGDVAGLAEPLDTGTSTGGFLGFCDEKADNSAGAASDIKVHIRSKGRIEIAVTGAASADNVGDIVYASDDDTFTLTPGANIAIGIVSRWVTGTTCEVSFEAIWARSL